jgi:hypothetical protein
MYDASTAAAAAGIVALNAGGKSARMAKARGKGENVKWRAGRWKEDEGRGRWRWRLNWRRLTFSAEHGVLPARHLAKTHVRRPADVLAVRAAGVSGCGNDAVALTAGISPPLRW